MSSFVEVQYEIERCSREIVRVIVPGQPDVVIRKGEAKKIVFGSVITKFEWYCEQAGESSKESSRITRGFNAVVIARHADGRRMDVRYGLET